MKSEEIRALGDDELKKLRLRLSTKQLVNHRELPRVKKDIARMMTILHERKLGIR